MVKYAEWVKSLSKLVKSCSGGASITNTFSLCPFFGKGCADALHEAVSFILDDYIEEMTEEKGERV